MNLIPGEKFSNVTIRQLSCLFKLKYDIDSSFPIENRCTLEYTECIVLMYSLLYIMRYDYYCSTVSHHINGVFPPFCQIACHILLSIIFKVVMWAHNNKETANWVYLSYLHNMYLSENNRIIYGQYNS